MSKYLDNTWHERANIQRFNFKEQTCGANPHKHSFAEYANETLLLIFYVASPMSIYERESQNKMIKLCRDCFNPSMDILIVESAPMKKAGRYIIKVEYHARCNQPAPEVILGFVNRIPEYLTLKSEEDLAEERMMAQKKLSAEAGRRYRMEHSDELKQYARDYHQAHREAAIEYGKKYRAAKKDEELRKAEENSSEVYFLSDEDQEYFEDFC